MKAHHSRCGFTLVEALLTIALVFVLSAMILPALTTSGGHRPRGAMCLNNLKQDALYYILWADDNGGRFPAATPCSKGGWQDLLTNGNAGAYCWTNYVIMYPYNRNPRSFICSSDTRNPATNFVMKGFTEGQGNAPVIRNSNISYFVGVLAVPLGPRSILAGDRNLSLGSTPGEDYGLSPADNKGNDVVIKTNLTYCWSRKMHTPKAGGSGSIAFADGHAEFVRSTALSRLFQSAANTTNSTPQPTNSDIRLVFP